MRELIGHEISKILNRPAAKLALLGMGIFTIAMLCVYVFPVSMVVQEEIDGEIVVTRGFDAVKRNKEIAGAYEGILTAEKVQDILETYSFSEELMEREGLRRQRDAPHNYLYDIIVNNFGEEDGSFKEDYFEFFIEDMSDGERDYLLGYSRGWEETICGLIVCFVVWLCVLAMLISPVFAEEYTRHTDALILSGKNGRTKCPAAKILAAYSVAVGGSLILIGVFILCLWFVHGFAGYQADTLGGTFFMLMRYRLCWRQAFALSAMLWLTAVLVFTSLVLVLSARTKGSFGALAASFAVLLAPQLLWDFYHNGYLVIELILMLMPFNQVQLVNIFVEVPVRLFGAEVEVVWFCLPMCAAITPLGILLSKRFFARHYVE